MDFWWDASVLVYGPTDKFHLQHLRAGVVPHATEVAAADFVPLHFSGLLPNVYYSMRVPAPTPELPC